MRDGRSASRKTVCSATTWWVWRPIGNPKELRVSAFLDDTARGFGLLQRDRDFDHYQDLEANYHARPSVWIEPRGDWGRGHVELVEIPAEGETTRRS